MKVQTTIHREPTFTVRIALNVTEASRLLLALERGRSADSSTQELVDELIQELDQMLERGRKDLA